MFKQTQIVIVWRTHGLDSTVRAELQLVTANDDFFLVSNHWECDMFVNQWMNHATYQ